MKISILAILFLFTLSSGYTQTLDSCCYEMMNSNEFYLMTQTQEEQVLVVDVRSVKEYKKERIESAHLAENKEALEKLLENESRKTIILVYCKEGKRSKKAAEIICSELNFPDVYHLSGGITQWKKEGYYVVKNESIAY